MKSKLIYIILNTLLSSTYLNAKEKEEVKLNKMITEIVSENKTLLDFLNGMKDSRKQAILDFHNQYLNLISKAKGSKSKHQAWEGGYQDHLTEMMTMAEQMYQLFSARRNLPFTLDQAIIVSYFHDLEKVFKYTTGEIIDKEEWYFTKLPMIGISFDLQEINALTYIHGESEKDYNPDTRLMNELAAFCHAVDNLSARMWHDKGRGTGTLGSLYDYDNQKRDSTCNQYR